MRISFEQVHEFVHVDTTCFLNHLFRWIPSAAKTISKRRMRWKDRFEYLELVRDLVEEAIVDDGKEWLLLVNTKLENEQHLCCGEADLTKQWWKCRRWYFPRVSWKITVILNNEIFSDKSQTTLMKL